MLCFDIFFNVFSEFQQMSVYRGGVVGMVDIEGKSVSSGRNGNTRHKPFCTGMDGNPCSTFSPEIKPHVKMIGPELTEISAQGNRDFQRFCIIFQLGTGNQGSQNKKEL